MTNFTVEILSFENDKTIHFTELVNTNCYFLITKTGVPESALTDKVDCDINYNYQFRFNLPIYKGVNLTGDSTFQYFKNAGVDSIYAAINLVRKQEDFDLYKGKVMNNYDQVCEESHVIGGCYIVVDLIQSPLSGGKPRRKTRIKKGKIIVKKNKTRKKKSKIKISNEQKMKDEIKI